MMGSFEFPQCQTAVEQVVVRFVLASGFSDKLGD